MSPLVVTLSWAALMDFLHWLDSPLLDFDFYNRSTLAFGFLLAGVGVAVAELVSFCLARTTINPRCPAKASQLVTGGVYRFTQNPMYLGMSSALLP